MYRFLLQIKYMVYYKIIHYIIKHNLLFIVSGVADVAHSTKLDCFTPPFVAQTSTTRPISS